MKFVDTDILIDFYRNYQPAVAFLDHYYSMDEILAISSITQMELFIGCRNKRELTETVKFLKQYEVVHFSRSISEKTVKLIREYNLSHGLLMADAIIAATALISDGELFSKNASDFVFIENLNITRPY
jgi:predicted nucleic acid-binding protein